MAVAIAHWNSMTVTMLKFVLETAGYSDVVTCSTPTQRVTTNTGRIGRRHPFIRRT